MPVKAVLYIGIFLGYKTIVRPKRVAGKIPRDPPTSYSQKNGDHHTELPTGSTIYILYQVRWCFELPLDGYTFDYLGTWTQLFSSTTAAAAAAVTANCFSYNRPLNRVAFCRFLTCRC